MVTFTVTENVQINQFSPTTFSPRRETLFGSAKIEPGPSYSSSDRSNRESFNSKKYDVYATTAIQDEL